MFNFKVYRSLILLVALPFITNCAPEFLDSPSVGPEKFCTLVGSVNSININVSGDYGKENYLAYSINSPEGDLIHDECSEDSNYAINGFGLSQIPINYYSVQRNENSLNINIPSYNNLYWSFFDQGFADNRPTTSDINIKIYSRKSCEESLELVEEFDSELEWNESFPNGRSCGGGGFSGSVQIQSDL